MGHHEDYIVCSVEKKTAPLEYETTHKKQGFINSVTIKHFVFLVLLLSSMLWLYEDFTNKVNESKYSGDNNEWTHSYTHVPSNLRVNILEEFEAGFPL